jgi:hypothetical protein
MWLTAAACMILVIEILLVAIENKSKNNLTAERMEFAWKSVYSWYGSPVKTFYLGSMDSS